MAVSRSFLSSVNLITDNVPQSDYFAAKSVLEFKSLGFRVILFHGGRRTTAELPHDPTLRGTNGADEVKVEEGSVEGNQRGPVFAIDGGLARS